MKVLQITRQFLPSIGGIEAVVDGLSHAVQKAGHDVEIVTLKKIFSTDEMAPDRSIINGLHVSRIRHFGLRRYPVAPQILKYVKNCDVLHIHAVDFFVDFLGWAKFLHQRPIVLSTHGGIFHTKWFSRLKSAYFRTMTRSSLRKVEAVLCVSEQDYQLFATIVPKEKLHLMRNGVDISAYARLSKKITPGLILGIGRVAENKCADRVIRAVADLQKAYPNAQLVWVGPDQDGRTSSLMELAASLGVSDRIEFVGRAKPAQLQDWLQRAHVFVCGSSYEGYGLSTIEAMSSGTVPVVTKVGIHPQIIEEGKSGFLVDGDPRAIARGLLAVLRLDAGTLMTMGENARRVSAKCSWDGVAQSYIGLYQSVLAN
jgi:alpha-1,3-mannosyltransferase